MYQREGIIFMETKDVWFGRERCKICLWIELEGSILKEQKFRCNDQKKLEDKAFPRRKSVNLRMWEVWKMRLSLDTRHLESLLSKITWVKDPLALRLINNIKCPWTCSVEWEWSECLKQKNKFWLIWCPWPWPGHTVSSHSHSAMETWVEVKIFRERVQLPRQECGWDNCLGAHSLTYSTSMSTGSVSGQPWEKSLLNS